jgi:hypothetical protein
MTNRQSTGMMDSLTASAAPTLLTANGNVPAAWNLIGDFTWATGYDAGGGRMAKPREFSLLFQALQGNPGAITAVSTLRIGYRKITSGYNQWWAQGKLSDEFLWRVPSINSNDYGWFSRATEPLANSELYKSSMAGVSLSEGSFSPGSVSNFLRPWYFHVNLSNARYTDEADALHIGNFSENIQPRYASDPFAANDPIYTSAPYPEFRQAYADPDDVVRRAMGAFAPYGGYGTSTGAGTSLDGLPEGQKPNVSNQDNRPIVLNRAFQSVADMGYAFRGSPWKNLSFSSPETGDAALLDVFCIAEAPPVMPSSSSPSAREQSAQPLVAGKVNLNTRQERVLQALLNGVLKDETSLATDSLLSPNVAALAAQSLVARTTSPKAWQGPLCNVSELAGKLFGKDLPPATFNMSRDPVYTSITYKTAYSAPLLSGYQRNPDMNPELSMLTWHFTGVSADLDAVLNTAKDRKNARMRESIIRALADGGQTRVWNIMLDLVAQTGRCLDPRNLEKFTKESERRVWVFLAIDRLTGEILDQQTEDIAD